VHPIILHHRHILVSWFPPRKASLLLTSSGVSTYGLGCHNNDIIATFKGTLGVIVSCDRLIAMDHFAQTDPCCCVYEQNQYLGEPAFFARTETLMYVLCWHAL
jgi:hypothetical protein